MMYGCSIDQRLMLPRPRLTSSGTSRSGCNAVPLDRDAAAHGWLPARLSRLVDIHHASQLAAGDLFEVHDVGMAAWSVEDRPDAPRHLEDVMLSRPTEEVDVHDSTRAVHEHHRLIGG